MVLVKTVALYYGTNPDISTGVCLRPDVSFMGFL